MEQQIQFRKITASDYRALEKIISDTWNYERFCQPQTAARMARLYLASCLANQSFTCVAVRHGEPVGVIMGKDEKRHRTPVRFALRMAGAAALLLSGRDGRRVAKLFGSLARVDEALLAQSGRKFDGELAFFAVRGDQRGTGVGKELFGAFQAYLKEAELKSFYLFTDSTCNFGFYEHQGLERIGETRYSLKPQLQEELQLFLYASKE